MHKHIHAIIHHPARVSGAVSLVSSLFVITGWMWAYAVLAPLGQSIIVSWSADTGIVRTVPADEFPSFLAGIGGTALLMVVVNAILAIELERRDRSWGKLVAFATALFAALIFTAFTAIISVNQ
ncbi:MAG: hypothetical protein RL681_573 [Candidatus Parcubacteria bacterium]|jgi:Sec-independent protein secretion pathway component TatC